MSDLTREILKRLAEPFALGVVKWKPQNVPEGGGRALAVAFIDARDVMGRLDAVVGGDWESRMSVVDNGHVLCDLTVCGKTRSDIGELGKGHNVDPLKSATSDALKRAAIHFGVGRYLYSLPLNWLPYDEKARRFMQEPQLPDWALPGGNGSHPAQAPTPTQQRADARPATPPRRKLPEAQPIPATASAGVAESVKSLRARMTEKLGNREPREATDAQKQLASRMLGKLFGDVPDESRRDMRRQLVKVVTGKTAIQDADNWELLDMHEASALIDWAKEDDGYGARPEAVSEAAAILAAFGESQGQQSLPEEMSTGDKVMALIGRCWHVYLGEEASEEDKIAAATSVFPKGFEGQDDLPFAIVSYFDQVLAATVAEDAEIELPNDAQVIGAITEAAGRAGQHTAVSALQVRADAVREYVASLDAEEVPF